MLQSTNDRGQDQSFALKVEGSDETGFKCTAKSFPQIPATEGKTAKQASMRMNTELQKRHREGTLKK